MEVAAFLELLSFSYFTSSLQVNSHRLSQMLFGFSFISSSFLYNCLDIPSDLSDITTIIGNFYPDILHDGNLERFFFLLTILMALNTLAYWKISYR